MTPHALGVALADGFHDARRFWPLIMGAFVHAIAACLLLGLSFQQVREAQEVAGHLRRWETQGAASLDAVYLAGPGALSGNGESEEELPLEDGRADHSAPAAAGASTSPILALLEDPGRVAYTVDFYGERFGDDLPGAMIVTEDLLAAFGLDTSVERTGQDIPGDGAGEPGPYAILGSSSTAEDPYALAVDGVLPPPTRLPFQGVMIPVVGRLAPGATVLDPNMGTVALDQSVLVVVPPSMLPAVYDRFGLDALLLRTVALGPGVGDVLDRAGRSLESPGLLVSVQPLTPSTSALLQSLSTSSRTVTVLYGAAVLGAVVSLFGVLSVLARGLGTTWHTAALVGAARWQIAVRMAVPVTLAWVVPAVVGLTAGTLVLPGPPPVLLTAGTVGLVLLVGVIATLNSWRTLAASFGRRLKRPDFLTPSDAQELS